VKQLVLAVMALSIAAFAPVGSHQCREVHDQVMQPIHNVASLLNMNPDFDTLSGGGCLYILQQLKTLPAGADLIRQVAAQGVEKPVSRCVYPINSVQYICNDPKTGEARCLPQAYTYCGQWEYSMTNEQRYELGMELGSKLDNAYDKAQQMCGYALRWDEAGTKMAMRELIAYLNDQVSTRGEKLYAAACNSNR
jgi:hypothetical protein